MFFSKIQMMEDFSKTLKTSQILNILVEWFEVWNPDSLGVKFHNTCILSSVLTASVFRYNVDIVENHPDAFMINPF